MSGPWRWPALVPAVALFPFVALVSGCGQPGEPERSAAPEIRWARAEVRDIRGSPCVVRCELAARKTAVVASSVPGAAVLEWLADEGSWVEEGDVVARFDATPWEQEALRMSNEWFRARQERVALESAELPLERLDLEGAAADAEGVAADEASFLETARGLAERGLMGESEIERQEVSVAAARARAEGAARRLELTVEALHPAKVARARAAEEAAERQWRDAASRAEGCVVRAPAAGVVGLVGLSVGGEWRVARVGDTLYRNQAFLCVADPREVVMEGEIGEGELPGVRVGWQAEGRSAALPGVTLRGRVENVGGIARGQGPGGGGAGWRKVFPVRIGVEEGGGEGLPLGVTVEAWVAPEPECGAVAVPRAAVSWREGRPMVRVRNGGEDGWEWRAVSLGAADAEWVAVREGLSSGEWVAPDGL